MWELLQVMIGYYITRLGHDALIATTNCPAPVNNPYFVFVEFYRCSFPYTHFYR